MLVVVVKVAKFGEKPTSNTEARRLCRENVINLHQDMPLAQGDAFQAL